jgi:hypothetical protein
LRASRIAIHPDAHSIRLLEEIMYRTIFIAGLLLTATTVAAEPAAKPDPQQRLQELDERVRQLEAERAARAVDKDGMRTTSNAFNPAISVVLNARYAAFEQDPATYALPGFALGADVGPGERGLSLGETELVFDANIDPNFYGSLTLALAPAGRETEVDLEEAYIQTLTLPRGFSLRAGRFNSGIGYLNQFHPHADDFADRPLPYRAMLANSAGDEGVYADDGVQLRWVAPTELFLELGAELLRGQSFPAGGAAKNGKGAHTAFVHIGGEVGPSHAWRLGVSRLKANARNRATGNATTPDLFTGSGELTGVDFIWKWAPNGNPGQTNFKFQMEYFTRDENGTFDPASSGTSLTYSGKQQGWYAQAVYQFVPRWRVGLRHDQLKANAVEAALTGTVLDKRGHDPRRTSVMADFSNSEFSRLRFQINQDESRLNLKDTQWYLQYIMSLGAHGGHPF